jgi:hypothetical protein
MIFATSTAAACFKVTTWTVMVGRDDGSCEDSAAKPNCVGADDDNPYASANVVAVLAGESSRPSIPSSDVPTEADTPALVAPDSAGANDEESGDCVETDTPALVALGGAAAPDEEDSEDGAEFGPSTFVPSGRSAGVDNDESVVAAAGAADTSSSAAPEDEGSDDCPRAELSNGPCAVSCSVTGRLINISATNANSVFWLNQRFNIVHSLLPVVVVV